MSSRSYLPENGVLANEKGSIYVLLNDTVHGHAPGSPPHIPRCLIPCFGKATPTGRIGPALPCMGGGPRPGYYYAGDLPDGE